MRRCSTHAVKFSQSINSDDTIVVILLVKDGYIDMNGLYFVTIEFSVSFYNYQGAKGTNWL